MAPVSSLHVASQPDAHVENHRRAEDRHGVDDGIVVLANQRILSIEAQAREVYGSLIELVPQIVGVPEEEALLLTDVLIHAAEDVAELVEAQIRAGQIVVGTQARGAEVWRGIRVRNCEA